MDIQKISIKILISNGVLCHVIFLQIEMTPSFNQIQNFRNLINLFIFYEMEFILNYTKNKIRLNYMKFNQMKLIINSYTIQKTGNSQNSRGCRVKGNFTRLHLLGIQKKHTHEKTFVAAICYVQKCGLPYFITFMCNPNWQR